ncbi:MAG TPA: glycosyltransferase, partial [Ktedonobacterales bacterium]|nr:glycosyltransferase [Ktedonobacterales bacterium]
LAALARASLLVPLPPGFSGSPQEINARMFVAAGAAAMLLDRDLTVASLRALLLPLLAEPQRLAAMGVAAAPLGHPHAANELADAVAALATRRGTAKQGPAERPAMRSRG